jgi:hypothetical protein
LAETVWGDANLQTGAMSFLAFFGGGETSSLPAAGAGDFPSNKLGRQPTTHDKIGASQRSAEVKTPHISPQAEADPKQKRMSVLQRLAVPVFLSFCLSVFLPFYLSIFVRSVQFFKSSAVF